nr:MAG TPA: hypothetical protein [Bacteriophage sp.]
MDRHYALQYDPRRCLGNYDGNSFGHLETIQCI